MIKFSYLLNQYRNEEQIEKLQLTCFNKILFHSMQNVPFYKEKFQKIRQKNIENLDEIRKFPLTTKNEMRRQSLRNLLAAEKNKTAFRDTTGGSTGEPFGVHFDSDSFDVLKTLELRYYLGIGYRPFKKVVEFYPNPHSTKNFLSKIGFWKFYGISTYLNEKKQFLQLKKMQPHIITSFPSTLLNLVKFNQHSELSPESIVLGGEVATPEVKKILGENFNTDIYENYSSTEGGLIAGDCSFHNGLHINSDAVILEFLGRKKSSGEHNKKGNIILTNLFNLMMPFIRYDTGDVGILRRKKCKCGNSNPMITHIEGRNNDFLILRNGRLVDPRSVDSSMRFFIAKFSEKYGWNIEKYQIIQEETDYVIVKIVKGKNFSLNDVKKIIVLMKKILGNNMKIEVKIVDEIKRTKAGKHRSVISRIHQNDIL